ncbi:MAG: hypothetical protein HYU66_10850 [Armatimonadetes bacterium]|nr:hypothetical protein [Armatimonadota bacterium]
MARGNAERPARAAALKALGELGGPDVFGKLLAVLPKLAADGLGGEAAAAAKLLQGQQGAAQATAGPVLAALEQATGDARPPLFSLLGPTGAPAASAVLLKALQDGPDADRAAAVAALGEWPDGAALEPVLQVVAAGQAGEDGRAATAAGRHLASLAGRDDAVVVDAVEQALGKVPAEARFSYLSGLAQVPHRRVLGILRGYLELVPQAGRALVDACEALAGAYRAEALTALDDASKVRDGQFKPAADRVRGMIGRWTDYITAWPSRAAGTWAACSATRRRPRPTLTSRPGPSCRAAC